MGIGKDQENEKYAHREVDRALPEYRTCKKIHPVAIQEASRKSDSEMFVYGMNFPRQLNTPIGKIQAFSLYQSP